MNASDKALPKQLHQHTIEIGRDREREKEKETQREKCKFAIIHASV